MVLQVCKITDRATARNNDNFTTEFLLKHYHFTKSERLMLHVLNKQMQVFHSKLVPARNKIISHSDRATILRGRALGGVAISEWDKFWLNLQEFVCIIHKSVLGDTLHINAIADISDADSLLKALRRAPVLNKC